MINGAQVSICNKYGETPLDKAKPHLREALRGILPHCDTLKYCLARLHGLVYRYILSLFIHHADKAEKLGQNMTKIPFKDTFWKGTTRTRPRESNTDT